ncbi:uncharacterized protein LOC143913658 [Arctopsyche grandis]|uniref:uncharacterized protein LOC143913658 n=1 Tax=Arctopsyche grandis TaxID=121162 RepID=UPI00406D9B49
MSLVSDKDKIISVLPFEYEYLFVGDYEYMNEQEFKCTINIKKIHTEDDAKKWISKFGECTLTTWRVRRTYPASGKCNIYKIAMKCQHNVDNYKFKTAHERKKNHISKHTGCPSTLLLTIKRYIKKSKARGFRSSDPSLIEWPCFVELKYIHNHPLDTAEVLRFRPLSNDIKEKLVILFKKGHTAASALESIKLELFLDYDEKYFEIASDRFYVPAISQVQYLFNQTFGVTNSKNLAFKPSLEDLLNNYNNSVSIGRAEVGAIGEHKFVTICSPIMSRAHEFLPHSSQIAIMESYGSIAKKSHKIYFIISPTPAGAVPLGCIITDSDKQDVLIAALANLKLCFPVDKSFYCQSFPFVFMTDDDAKKQESIKLHWPKSSILLCQCHVVKCAWNWLNCNNNVPKSMREEIYYSVKQLIYCPTEKDLWDLYTYLHKKYAILPKFVTYLETMWPNRPLWSSAYRSNVPVNENCAFNYVEVTFKIMKECLMERIQNYDLTQLIDFILVHYEAYVKRRLIDYSRGKVCKSLLYKYIPPTCIINPSMIIPSEIDNTCYFVPSESDYSIKYMVDVKHCICSCDTGKTGQLCKHLCGVINQIENPTDGVNAPQNFKDMLHLIATGSEPDTEQDESPAPDSPLNDVEHVEERPILELSDKESKQLMKFFDALNDGLKNQSKLFVPAVRTMLKTYSKMKCEIALANSVKMFGKNVNSANKVDMKCKNQKKFAKKKIRHQNTLQKKFVAILPKVRLDSDVLSDPLAV